MNTEENNQASIDNSEYHTGKILSWVTVHIIFLYALLTHGLSPLILKDSSSILINISFWPSIQICLFLLAFLSGAYLFIKEIIDRNTLIKIFLLTFVFIFWKTTAQNAFLNLQTDHLNLVEISIYLALGMILYSITLLGLVKITSKIPETTIQHTLLRIAFITLFVFVFLNIISGAILSNLIIDSSWEGLQLPSIHTDHLQLLQSKSNRISLLTHQTLSIAIFSIAFICWIYALFRPVYCFIKTGLNLLIGIFVIQLILASNDWISTDYTTQIHLIISLIEISILVFLIQGSQDYSSTKLEQLSDEDDFDFMSDLHAAMLQQSPKGACIVLWVSVLFFGSTLFWASVAELDEITRGEGKVIPSQKIQVIQNLEGGILEKLLIQEGQIVNAGEILLLIENTRFLSSFKENQLQINSLKSRDLRLSAEAEGSAFTHPTETSKDSFLIKQEYRLFEERQIELNNNIEILNEQVEQRIQELKELKSRTEQINRSLKLVQRELDMTQPLVEEGVSSEVDILKLEREVNELEGNKQNTSISYDRVHSTLLESKRKVRETTLRFRNEARKELNELRSKLSQLTVAQSVLKDSLSRTEVRAPVRGTIKLINVNTIGGVIQPGMDMLEIVPLDDTLLIEAKVRPSDIGFLHPGQKTVVKFTAYDFSIYGGIEGNIEHISADSMENEQGDSFYIIRIRTKESHMGTIDEPLPIIPGMQASVDILTGKRTVLNYLLKPILKATGNALKER